MRWRLLIDEPAAGAVNMAVDETLLESAERPDSIPTVRFYGFSSPTLTFGYGQKLSEAVNEERCRSLQIDCIRRITGGRALLHQHELTYSVTASTSCPLFSRSVKSAYRTVRGTLHKALANLGVPLDPEGSGGRTAEPAERASPELPCLSVPTGHEITTRGRKIVAASMRWRRRAFLLHGSILWTIDRPLWRHIACLDDGAALHATGILEACAHGFGKAELVDALTSSFQELLSDLPEKAPLTGEEANRTGQLAVKYRSEDWSRGLAH